MKHEELIELSMNDNFVEAKDFIMEGLSYRLNPHENQNVKKLQINIEPRINYGPEMEKKLIDNFAYARNKEYEQ